MRFARKNLLSLVGGLVLCASAAAGQSYDLVILNGRVIDPETQLDAERNVGVKNGRIEVVTEKKIVGSHRQQRLQVGHELAGLHRHPLRDRERHDRGEGLRGGQGRVSGAADPQPGRAVNAVR